MKGIVLHIIAAGLFVIGGARTAACAEGDLADKFEVGLVLSQTSIFPYEPVSVALSIKNKSDKPQTFESTWAAFLMLRFGEHGKWETYAWPGPRGVPPPPSVGTLQPGAVINRYFQVDLNADGNHVFSKPGKYWAKITWAGLQSQPQQLEVRTPAAGDKQAVEHLGQVPLYRYFSDRWTSLYLREAAALSKELQALVGQFPRSRYAWWARLGLLLVQKHRSGENAAALKAIQTQMEQLAPQAPAPINAAFWYEAGMVAASRGDGTAAHANFEKAIATKASATLADQIAYLKAQGLIPARAAAPPDDGLTDELRESLTNQLKIFMAAAREGYVPVKGYFTDDFVWEGKLNGEQTAALIKARGTSLRTGGPYPDDLIELEVVSFDRLGKEVMATVKITISPTGKPEVQQCQFILRPIDGNWYIRRWDGDILKRLEEK